MALLGRFSLISSKKEFLKSNDKFLEVFIEQIIFFYLNKTNIKDLIKTL